MADSSITGSQSVDQINAAFIAAQQAAAAKGTASKTDATASQQTLGSDENFFLTMLTTQLKNQDPTSPMDTTAMTQQIATYSGVQQQVTTNANLEKLIAAQNQSTTSQAVGYIGKEIESAGNTGLIIGGQGAFSYSLPKAAANAHVTITNSSGTVVFSGAGTTTAGRNVVIWDGVNSTTGAQEADGTYTLSVTANDAANIAITPTINAVTIVSGVETDSSGNTMLIPAGGGSDVKFSDVLAVRTPTRAQTTTASSSTDTGTGTSTSSASTDTSTSGT